jgi:hypothetical protein
MAVLLIAGAATLNLGVLRLKKFVSAILARDPDADAVPGGISLRTRHNIQRKAVTFIEEIRGLRAEPVRGRQGLRQLLHRLRHRKCDKDAYPDGVTQAQAEQMLKRLSGLQGGAGSEQLPFTQNSVTR